MTYYLVAGAAELNCLQNIAHYYGWFEHENRIHIAMEYYPAGDLDNYLKENGPVTKITFLKILYDLSLGLETLHNLDIAHRDLKPAV